MLHKNNLRLLILLLLVIISGCIVEYFPKMNDYEELLVVDGLITDQPGINTIKLSKSLPLWNRYKEKPLNNCIVSISDDIGQVFTLKEIKSGTYVTDSTTFRGIIGRTYSLHIKSTVDSITYTYNSTPMLMKPVPKIDSIYYEKKVFNTKYRNVTGCQIFLDTHDPLNNCRYFRWNYSETWEIHLPSVVTHRICWLSDKSKDISIKNTTILSESRITRFPIKTISDPNDRLSVKYSILVNQLSLNDDEYLYWERLKNTAEQVGGLYDQVPSIIPNNLHCEEDPEKPVLGYFSVSALSSKRIFIKDNFDWVYTECSMDTIYGTGPLPILDVPVFVVKDNTMLYPPHRIVTYKESCTDCRKRGTEVKPTFWENDK
jgi:hypothetical protein